MKHLILLSLLLLVLVFSANPQYLNASDFSLSFIKPSNTDTSIIAGQKYLVKWQVQGDAPSKPSYYKLFLKCSGDQNWRTISTLKPSVSQYNWQVPNSSLTDCQLALALYAKSTGTFKYSIYSKALSPKFNIIKSSQIGADTQSIIPSLVGVSGSYPAGETFEFPKNLTSPILFIYPDISITIPDGYIYSPRKNWWNNPSIDARLILQYTAPASAYRAVPVNTSRQFRAVVVNPGGAHSDPLDNSNIIWSIESYLPEIMKCFSYQSQTQKRLLLNVADVVEREQEQNPNEQISSALNIPLTTHLALSDIGPFSDISRWLVKGLNNIWTFNAQKAKEMQFANTKFTPQKGFCDLTKEQTQKIENYSKEKYGIGKVNAVPSVTIISQGGVPISFNGDEILKISDTGLIQAGAKKGYAKVVVRVKNNTQIRESRFAIRVISLPISSEMGISNPSGHSGVVQICGNTKHIDFNIAPVADPIWIMKNSEGALNNPGSAWAFNLKQDLAWKNSIRAYVKPDPSGDMRVEISAFSLSQPNIKNTVLFRYLKVCTPGCSKSSFLRCSLFPYLGRFLRGLWR